MDVARQKSYVKSYREGQHTKYKPCAETPVISTLEDLIRELYVVFESETVNVEYVQQLMSMYKSNPVDWRRYAKFDRCRYTRNLVDEGNGKFNLLILCWGEGHGSAIHDHADAHCFMKVLQGSLNEVRFAWPERNRIAREECVDNRDDNSRDHKVLKETSREQLHLNEVTYINDSIGLHRVENLSNINSAVSLHLYCPPYSKCNIFNELTGQSTLTNVTFWSKYGEKRDRDIQSSRDPEDN
ncbi:cysteine dioxygenase type 1 [Cryptotermes secundus]|uniref:cysteine dioxygenase type 1 n=1 Tax=Cryptotermes secundus TaxID=105785 RepID=UPI000CD7CAC2|nr:cysteine dioxygenase type 1 [Cryptotermes secundus]XP_023707344.1 cysteine dioxygenase type 1 [Cryptotermes secundus]